MIIKKTGRRQANLYYEDAPLRKKILVNLKNVPGLVFALFLWLVVSVYLSIKGDR